MRQVEFDLGTAEEILADDEGDVASEGVFAGDQHPPIPVHVVADRELVEQDGLDGGLAAHPAIRLPRAP